MSGWLQVVRWPRRSGVSVLGFAVGLDGERERESADLLGGWPGSQERKRERKHWAGLAVMARLATIFPKLGTKN